MELEVRSCIQILASLFDVLAFVILETNATHFKFRRLVFFLQVIITDRFVEYLCAVGLRLQA